MSKAESTAAAETKSGTLDQIRGVILVVGRSGSGKSFFIEAFCTHQDTSVRRKRLEPTSDVTIHRVEFEGGRIILIDTPGFDNPYMSNETAFSKLADFLIAPAQRTLRVSGIVYIHRAGDPIKSRAFIQNLGVLSDVLLGDSGISRLVVAVVPKGLGMFKPTSVVQSLASTSIFHQLRLKDAIIEASTLEGADVSDIVLSCVDRDPVVLRAQHEGARKGFTVLKDQIEEGLGYYEKESMQKRFQEQVSQSLNSQTKEIESLKCTVDKQLKELKAADFAHRVTKGQLALKEAEVDELRQQLEELQHKYESLSSQLGLEEIEEEDVIAAFEELNKNIEDLGRSISVHLVEIYAKHMFEQDICDLTALNAHQLSKLQTLLGHEDEKSSVIASSDGTGMPIEDFFDYAIRTLLCQHLYKKVFEPFHPTAEPSRNEVLLSMYSDIQLEENQLGAGKWRSITFKSLFRGETEATCGYRTSLIAQEFVNQFLAPLISCFFGYEAEIWLENKHLDGLVQVVQAAWDWNSTLKGEIVSLGLFSPTYYSPFHTFDPELMVEQESNAQYQPEYILATTGFGLRVSRAADAQEDLETSVTLKAGVVSSFLYIHS